MGKMWRMALVVLLVCAFSSVVLAEEINTSAKNPSMMQGGMMGQDMMGGPGMMGKDKMGPRPPMMDKAIVATADGGVVVLIGNKLQKYDKDLVFQKEVELKGDKRDIGMKPDVQPMPVDKK